MHSFPLKEMLIDLIPPTFQGKSVIITNLPYLLVQIILISLAFRRYPSYPDGSKEILHALCVSHFLMHSHIGKDGLKAPGFAICALEKPPPRVATTQQSRQASRESFCP